MGGVPAEFTFVLKHINGQAKKVADALSRRNLILQESTIQVLGFEHLKDTYEADADFKEAYEACQNLFLRDNNSWLDCNMQEGLVFKRGQLCILKCSMRENLIQEKHNGGLARHFGIDKTFDQLSHFYYWLKMCRDVQRFVTRCKVCQLVKGHRVVYTLSYSEQTMGLCQFRLCLRSAEDTMGIRFHHGGGGLFHQNGTFHSVQENQ